MDSVGWYLDPILRLDSRPHRRNLHPPFHSYLNHSQASYLYSYPRYGRLSGLASRNTPTPVVPSSLPRLFYSPTRSLDLSHSGLSRLNVCGLVPLDLYIVTAPSLLPAISVIPYLHVDFLSLRNNLQQTILNRDILLHGVDPYLSE